MAPNHKRRDTGNFDRRKRISKMLSLHEKVKVLKLVRKVKIKHAEVTKTYAKNGSVKL